MTIKRIFALISLAVMLLSTSACGFLEEDIQEKVMGKWYNSDGNYIEIQSDGTVKFFTYELENDGELENSVQMGTWTFLENEKIFKFFLGDSIFEVSMRESDHGSFLNLGDLGSFYKATEDSRWYKVIECQYNFNGNWFANYTECEFLRSDGQFKSRLSFSKTRLTGKMVYEYDSMGKILKITDETYNETLEYTYEKDGGNYVGTSSATDTGEYFLLTYNKHGQLIKNEEYKNDTLQGSTEYTYHKNGNIATEIHIDPNASNFDGFWQFNLVSGDFDTYTEKIVANRDERGNIITKHIYVDDNIDVKVSAEYKNNRFVSKKTEGNLYSDEEEYTEIEKVTESTETSVKTAVYYNDELTGYNKYTYDSFNNLIKFEHYNKENELSYEYDYVWSVAP